MQQMTGNYNFCRDHSRRPAPYKCENCGEYFCDKCVLPAGDSRPVCRGCAVQMGLPNARSKGLTNMGQIVIFLGSLGLLLDLHSFVGKPLFKSLNQGAGNVLAQKLSTGPLYKSLLVFGVITSILLLCAGIGLLKLKRWAFGAVIVYCVISILPFIVNAIRTFSMMGSVTSTYEQGFIVGATFGGLIIGLALPVIYLVCITRPAIKAQLRA